LKINNPFSKLFGSKLPPQQNKQIPNSKTMSVAVSPYYDKSQISPYNPDEIVQKTGSLNLYQKMRTDDQVKAVLTMKKNAVLAKGWNIVGEDDEYNDFITHCFTEPLDISKRLFEVLSALDYGFSVSELLEGYAEKGDYKGKIILTGIKTRPPHSFRFETDKSGNLKHLWQYTDEGELDLPISKFIIYSYNSEFGNLYGDSDLRAAYRPWFGKDITIKFRNIYNERFGMPTVMGEYKPGMSEPQQAELEKIIENIQAMTSIKIPEGVKISLLEATRKGSPDYKDAIQDYDIAIARSILVPDLMGFSTTKSGSFALGEKQFEVFLWILEKLQGDLERKVKIIIRRLIDLNFPNVTNYPKLVFNPLTKDDTEGLAKIFLEAVKNGVILPIKEDEDHLRKSLNFPERTSTDPAPATIKGKVDKDNPFEEDDEDDEVNPKGNPRKKVPGENTPQSGDDELTGPGGHKPNKTGPHGRGAGPGKGKGDGSGLKEYAKRKLTEYEKKVDFTGIETALNKEENIMMVKAGAIIQKSGVDLIGRIFNKKIIEEQNLGEIERLSLKYMNEFKSLWKLELPSIYRMGFGYAKSEVIGRQYDKATIGNFEPKMALRYFEQQAYRLTDTEKARILGGVKNILYGGLKYGKTNAQVKFELEEFFSKYTVLQKVRIGAETVIMPVDEIPGRLKTIIRTNYSDAYNQGRLGGFQDPTVKDMIKAYQYSAIMDKLTTPFCASMDTNIYKANDPIISSYNPPNHFNCRSMWVPILAGEEFNVSRVPAIKPAVGFA